MQYFKIPAYAVKGKVCLRDDEGRSVSLSPLKARAGDNFAVTSIEPDGTVTGFIYATANTWPTETQACDPPDFEETWEVFPNFREAYKDAMRHMPLFAITVTPRQIAPLFGKPLNELPPAKMARLLDYCGPQSGVLDRIEAELRTTLHETKAAWACKNDDIEKVIEPETVKKAPTARMRM